MGRALVAAGLLLLLAIGAGWALTPSGADVDARSAALAGAEGARVVSSDQLPPDLVNALVATEDERFFAHHGIDAIGIGRALLADIQQGCLCEGGSTITQQLAKQVYLGGDDHGWNKLRGVFIAFKLESLIGKRQILADYLSVTPFGYSRYGVANAACDYFGEPPQRLSLAQSALLAGMPQAPSAYDPIRHPEAARRRRAQVLGLMRGHAFISEAEEGAALAAPLLGRTAVAGTRRDC